MIVRMIASTSRRSQFSYNIFERAVIWAALSERSYEEGPAIYCGRCTRSTTKNAHTQVNEHFL